IASFAMSCLPRSERCRTGSQAAGEGAVCTPGDGARRAATDTAAAMTFDTPDPADAGVSCSDARDRPAGRHAPFHPTPLMGPGDPSDREETASPAPFAGRRPGAVRV